MLSYDLLISITISDDYFLFKQTLKEIVLYYKGVHKMQNTLTYIIKCILKWTWTKQTFAVINHINKGSSSWVSDC